MKRADQFIIRKQKVRVREGKGTELLWEKVTIPVNDWNDRKNAEVWRESWAKHCNRYLDKDNQIDHRSYERQGLDIMPSIHEGDLILCHQSMKVLRQERWKQTVK